MIHSELSCSLLLLLSSLLSFEAGFLFCLLVSVYGSLFPHWFQSLLVVLCVAQAANYFLVLIWDRWKDLV